LKAEIPDNLPLAGEKAMIPAPEIVYPPLCVRTDAKGAFPLYPSQQNCCWECTQSQLLCMTEEKCYNKHIYVTRLSI